MKFIRALTFLASAGLVVIAMSPAAASVGEDMKAVAELDTRFQAAVEKNDAETMASIHHEDMVLVFSNETVRRDCLR
jgi:hypothetical protein